MVRKEMYVFVEGIKIIGEVVVAAGGVKDSEVNEVSVQNFRGAETLVRPKVELWITESYNDDSTKNAAFRPRSR